METEPQGGPWHADDRVLAYAGPTTHGPPTWPIIGAFLLVAAGAVLQALATLAFQSEGYAFVWPFYIVEVTLVCLAVAGLAMQKQRRRLLIATMCVVPLLPATAYYAMSQWPGGDDGCGMAFLFLGLGGSVVLALLTLIVGVVALAMCVDRRKLRASP